MSVGGFLSIGTKYVVVPFTSLQVIDKRMVLRGATKDALKALPEFKYNGKLDTVSVRDQRRPMLRI